MENSTAHICEDIPWQASILCLTLHLNDKLTAALQTPGIVQQRAPEKLTKEAVFMICVILAFVLLAVSGSLITAYEFFFSDNNAKYLRNDSKNSVAKKSKNKNESLEKHARFEDCKSFLKCFCFLKNGSKILNIVSAEGQVDSIQGLRVIFNIFIIVVHAGLFYFNLLKNIHEAKPVIEMRVSQLFLNGVTAVNFFFVISAYLNAKSFLSKYSRNNGNISWFEFYFKRFMRLTPVYMIVLGSYTTLFSYTGSGIIWPTYATNPVCKESWWWNLLYINNMGEVTKECMSWCWYLAADMQFYIISPLFMILLLRRPWIGYTLLIASVSGSAFSSFLLTYQYNLSDGTARLAFFMNDMKYFNKKFLQYFDVEYRTPYTRINNYLVGILLAYYLFKKQINGETTKNKALTLWCGWILTFIMMWVSFFFLYNRKEILVETALFNSTKNYLCSCGSAWIIYSCITEQAGFFCKCLSWKYLLPFSRLSYCTYLVHPIVIHRMILQSEYLMDFTFMSVVLWNVKVCALTYAVSFIASLLFEIPVQNLLNWFDTHKRKDYSSKIH